MFLSVSANQFVNIVLLQTQDTFGRLFVMCLFQKALRCHNEGKLTARSVCVWVELRLGGGLMAMSERVK